MVACAAPLVQVYHTDLSLATPDTGGNSGWHRLCHDHPTELYLYRGMRAGWIVTGLLQDCYRRLNAEESLSSLGQRPFSLVSLTHAYRELVSHAGKEDPPGSGQ